MVTNCEKLKRWFPADPIPVNPVVKLSGFRIATKLPTLESWELEAEAPTRESTPFATLKLLPRPCSAKPLDWSVIGSAFAAGAIAIETNRTARPKPALVNKRIWVFLPSIKASETEALERRIRRR